MIRRHRRRASQAALAAALCCALAGCGGTGGLTASVDTPLFDVEVSRTPPTEAETEAGTDAGSQLETAAPAAAPAVPPNITTTVGQDRAVVINGDVTLALPPGVSLQEALQGALGAPEPPQDREPGPDGEADAEADTAAGQGQTAGTIEAVNSPEAPAAPESLLERPTTDTEEADGDGPAGSAEVTDPPEHYPVSADRPQPPVTAPDLYLENLAGREGFSAHRYCDGTYVAIGHGHLVVDPATGRYLLCEDWATAQAAAERVTAPFLWAELDAVRRDVLAEIAFMTGRGGLMDFTGLYVALYQHDYPRAAAEIRDSTLGCPAGQPYLVCVSHANGRREYLAELMAEGPAAAQ